MNTRITYTALVTMLILGGGCNRSRETVFTGTVFGTPYEVRMVPLPKAPPKGDIEKSIIETCRTMESVFNHQDPESELSRFNKSTRLIWVPTSRALVTVVSQALETAKLTNGAWDPTSGKLSELYKSTTKAPGPAAIANAKAKVGYHYLEARQDPLALKKSKQGILLDLRIPAQGYAIDEISEVLKRKGVENYRVKIGQVIRASGTNARGEKWPYSYQKPVAGAQVPLHLTSEVIAVDNRSAATFSLPEAKDSAGPAIDPRSGTLLETDLLNVTVLDRSALKAVTLASGLFSVGKSEAITLARKEALAAFFVAQTEEKGLAEATPLFPSPIKSTY